MTVRGSNTQTLLHGAWTGLHERETPQSMGLCRGQHLMDHPPEGRRTAGLLEEEEYWERAYVPRWYVSLSSTVRNLWVREL